MLSSFECRKLDDAGHRSVPSLSKANQRRAEADQFEVDNTTALRVAVQ